MKLSAWSGQKSLTERWWEFRWSRPARIGAPSPAESWGPSEAPSEQRSLGWCCDITSSSSSSLSSTSAAQLLPPLFSYDHDHNTTATKRPFKRWRPLYHVTHCTQAHVTLYVYATASLSVRLSVTLIQWRNNRPRRPCNAGGPARVGGPCAKPPIFCTT